MVAGQHEDGAGVPSGDRAPRAPRPRCRRAAAGRRSRRPPAAPPRGRGRARRSRRPAPRRPRGRRAPASATIGRPHTGCRTLGSDERIRVPSPAAMTRTVGAPLTRGIVGACGAFRELSRARWAGCGDMWCATCPTPLGSAYTGLTIRGGVVGSTPGFGPGSGGSNPPPGAPCRATVRHGDHHDRRPPQPLSDASRARRAKHDALRLIRSPRARWRLRDRIRAVLVGIASRFANYRVVRVGAAGHDPAAAGRGRRRGALASSTRRSTRSTSRTVRRPAR